VASTSEILTDMRDDLAAWMAQRGYGDAVYIAEVPIEEFSGAYAIQIIAGPDNAVHPNSGVGLIRTTIDLVVWWRGMLDPMGRGTERIAGEAGIQQFVDVLREYLVQRFYDGMTIPLIFRNGGTLEIVEGVDGWCTLKDTYDFAYEMTWVARSP
jgi:hypothetical protein